MCQTGSRSSERGPDISRAPRCGGACCSRAPAPVRAPQTGVGRRAAPPRVTRRVHEEMMRRRKQDVRNLREAGISGLAVPPIVLIHNGSHFDACVIPPEEWREYVASL